MGSHAGQQFAGPGGGQFVIPGIKCLIEQQVFNHREALNGHAGLADHLRSDRFLVAGQVSCFPRDQILRVGPELELPGKIVVFDRSEIDKAHPLPGQEGIQPGGFQLFPALRGRIPAVVPGAFSQSARFFFQRLIASDNALIPLLAGLAGGIACPHQGRRCCEDKCAQQSGDRLHG